MVGLLSETLSGRVYFLDQRVVVRKFRVKPLFKFFNPVVELGSSPTNLKGCGFLKHSGTSLIETAFRLKANEAW